MSLPAHGASTRALRGQRQVQGTQKGSISPEQPRKWTSSHERHQDGSTWQRSEHEGQGEY
eukprot:1820230-Pleurochrysis_carterae.AAC.3